MQVTATTRGPDFDICHTFPWWNTQPIEKHLSYPASGSCRWSLLTTCSVPSISIGSVSLCCCAPDFVGSSHTPSLHRPWWIPLTSWAELRGLILGFFGLSVKTAHRLAVDEGTVVLLDCQRPSDSSNKAFPLFRALAFRWLPANRGSYFLLTLPDAQLQGRGLRLPLLEKKIVCLCSYGYHWRVATSTVTGAAAPSSIPSSLASQALWLRLAFGPYER